MMTLNRKTTAPSQRKVSLGVGLALALIAANGLAAEPPVNPNVDAAKGVIKAFSTQLKSELKAAIEKGGPVEAIAVCKDRAPAIAEEVGKQSGWQVGRVSLKPRNGELGTPDDWERGVLEEFAQRKANGEDLQGIAHAEVVATEGGSEFRFMKAIPTGEPCLACHGQSIAPEVVEAIDENYPDDQARGFSQGDLRGAFSLVKPL